MVIIGCSQDVPHTHKHSSDTEMVYLACGMTMLNSPNSCSIPCSVFRHLF